MASDDSEARANVEDERRTRTLERVRVSLRRLERVTLKLEHPVDRFVGSARLNPLYHTGTISVYLFAIVVLTGIYLTMWFQFGFEESYAAVAGMEGHPIGRVMRALHLYGSIALVVTSLLHGWRTFAQDKFRGPRWVAWVSGISMVAILWIVGVTGYWLLWDERAQVLNEALIRALSGTRLGLDFLLDNLLTPTAGSGWPFLLLLFLIHVGLSIVIGVLLWYHIRRLAHRVWLPPRFWIIVIGGVLLLLSILLPVGLLPPVDVTRIPDSIPLDPFYLFLLPLALAWPPVWVWGGFLAVGVALSLLPWLKREPLPPEIVVDEDRCTGCTLCVIDCPYGALEMIPREDGKRLQVAVVVENRCVSCSICIGSCADDALSYGDHGVDDLIADVLITAASTPSPKILLLCDQHVHLAAPVAGENLHVFSVGCIGAVHPRLVENALEAGASAVQLIGCLPGDCGNRFGNTWAQARLDRTRAPRLKRRYTEEPIAPAITSDWVSPIEIASAVENPGMRSIVEPAIRPGWRRTIPLLTLVVAVSLLSIAVTKLPFSPGPADMAVVSIAMQHRPGAVVLGHEGDPDLAEGGGSSRLVVHIGDAVVLDEEYPTVELDGVTVSQALERIEVVPGRHQIEILLYDRVDPSYVTVLANKSIHFLAGDVVNFAFINDEGLSAAERGEMIFFDQSPVVNPGCSVCHSLAPGQVIVGPSLGRVGSRAETRVPGLTGGEYLHHSIISPNTYIVGGFPADVMPQHYEDLLTPDQISDLVAFLLTLE